MGISPDKLLLLVELEFARRHGFKKMVGVNRKHVREGKKITLPYPKIYKQFGLTRKHPLGFWKSVESLLTRWETRAAEDSNIREKWDLMLEAFGQLWAYQAEEDHLPEKREDLETSRGEDQAMTGKSIAGRYFRPELNFRHGEPISTADIDKIRSKAKRGAEEVIALLQRAKELSIELSITGHLRGIDGPGSSLDLPEFQRGLTPIKKNSFEQIPSTPTIASEFFTTVKFELADDSQNIVYVAPDYGIFEENPMVFSGDVRLEEIDPKKRQRYAPGFIFRNLFGLKGIKITLEGISPMALAGGMESSNVFNTALIAAASMLSGVDLSQAEIFSLAVKMENDEFVGLTGGQGHLATLLGGAYQHIWLSGIKDDSGHPVNPYSAISVPLVGEDGLGAIEEHVMLVQAGKEYVDGEAKIGRTASSINFMWMDLLRDQDPVGLRLHKEKITLTAEYVRALREKDFDKAAQTVIRYVEIREQLIKRWLQLMIDAKNDVEGTPPYAYRYQRKVFDDEKHREYKIMS